MVELDIYPIPDTLPPKEKISGMMVQDKERCLKRVTPLPCTMLEQVLMAMGEMNICLSPALLPPIIKVILVDHQVLIVMVMTEVDIGLRPANFIHITMVE